MRSSRPQMGPEILYVMFLYGYLDSEPPFFAGGCIPDPPGLCESLQQERTSIK